MKIEKLKDDPIVETLLEIQFTSPELQEVTVGRLSDIKLWTSAVKQRLAVADIPASFRVSNPVLMHQPTVEINVPNVGIVRIGGNVLSMHFLKPYKGWNVVYPILVDALQQMFAVVPSLTATRLGLRYINAFTSNRHYVNSIADLALVIEVAKAKLAEPLTLGYISGNASHEVMTKVVSKHFAQGTLPPETTVIADIDVYTPRNLSMTKFDQVRQWVEDAHSAEKDAFANLLPKDLYLKLKDQTNATH